MQKTLISGILALAMFLTLLPTGALAANHDLTVTGESGGYSWKDDQLSFTQAGSYTLRGTTGKETVVIDGKDVVLTLDGVSIDVSSSGQSSELGKCALALSNTASATIVLAGDNSLKSGNGYAGLRVPLRAALTIGGDGNLAAQGGKDGAGIGADGGSGTWTAGAIRIQEQAAVTASGDAVGIGNITVKVMEHFKDNGVYGTTDESANTATENFSDTGPDGHVRAEEHRTACLGQILNAQYGGKYRVETEEMAADGTITLYDPDDSGKTAAIKVKSISTDLSGKTVIDTEAGTFSLTASGEYSFTLLTDAGSFIDLCAQGQRWIWDIKCTVISTTGNQAYSFPFRICFEGTNEQPYFTGLANTDYFGEAETELSSDINWTATAAGQGGSVHSDVIIGQFLAEDKDKDARLGFDGEYMGGDGINGVLLLDLDDLTLANSQPLADFSYPGGDNIKAELPAGNYKKFQFNVGDFYLNVETGRYFFNVNDGSQVIKDMPSNGSCLLPFTITVFDEYGASSDKDFAIKLWKDLSKDASSETSIPDLNALLAEAFDKETFFALATANEAPDLLASGGDSGLTIAGGIVTAESTDGKALSCQVVIEPAKGQAIYAKAGSGLSDAKSLRGSPFYFAAGGHDVTSLIGSERWFASETHSLPIPSDQSHTLTFDTRRGKAIPSITRSPESIVNLSDYVPVREHYAFDGWFIDKALKLRVTRLSLWEDTTVYAGWKYTGENPFEDVMFMNLEGLMKGTAANEFSPNRSATRGMAVTMLWRLEGRPDSDFAMSFTDVAENTYYTPAIRWAAEKGLAEGYGDNRFCPDKAMTRQELAVFLYRYAAYKGYDISVGEETNILSYIDISKVDSWAIPAIQWAVGSRIMNGTGDALLPADFASRSQAAAMFRRFMEEYVPVIPT